MKCSFIESKTIVVKKNLFPLKQLIVPFLLVFITSASWAADRYWVGGSGAWNDPSHWSNSSGGSGGAGVPGQNDDVFFDENSFSQVSTVQIDGQVYCKSFSWDGTTQKHTLTGNGELFVRGSYVFNSLVNYNFNGAVHLIANNGAKTIKAGVTQIKSDFFIEGGAKYYLEDNFGIGAENDLIISEGELYTNDHMIYAGTFKTVGSGNKEVHLGNSELIIMEEWDLETGSNLTFDIAQSKIELSESIPPAMIRKGGTSSNTTNYIIRVACANPIPIDFDAVVTSNYNGAQISCQDSCDAVITVTVNAGGGGPYGYVWQEGGNSDTTNTSFVTGGVFNGLCAGTYNVTVYDTAQPIFGSIYESCTQFNVVIVEPPALGVNVLGIIDPSCPDSCDGTIFTSIGGGTGTLSIEWPTIAPFPNTNASPAGVVCTGSHDVIVVDDNGCTDTVAVAIADPPPLVAGLNITEILCGGDCNADGTATPSGGNGGAFQNFVWSDTTTNTTISTTTAVSGLCADSTYRFYYEDVDGCPADTVFTIANKPEIIVTVATTDSASCFGECDAQMTLTVVGGTAAYDSINWYSGVPGAATAFSTGTTTTAQTGLCADSTYFVIVYDDGGCADTTIVTQPLQPDEIFFNGSHTDIVCFGDDNGTITLNPFGGSISGYLFDWDDDGTGDLDDAQDRTGLAPGTYCVRIYDAYEAATGDSSCFKDTCFTIVEPDAITANGVVTDITCFQADDATIDQTPAGGAGGFGFSWTSVPVMGLPNSEDQGPLSPATYSVTITDANLCTLDTTYVITEPDPIVANATVTMITCNGADDGTITFNPQNGTAPYSYDWNDGNGFVSNADTTGLPVGCTTVSIRDVNGCLLIPDTTICITEPDAIDIAEVHTDITCFGFDDGTITATITDGTPALGWTWNSTCATWTGAPATNQTNLTGLCPGDYEVVVTDGNGCMDSLTITINEPAAIDLAPVITQISCFGGNNGAVDLTPTGGSGTFEFDWDMDGTGDFDDVEDASSLSDGTYCLRIRDQAQPGCFMDTCWTFVEPDQITFGGTILTDSCFGADGTIELNINGGTEPYANVDWDWDLAGDPSVIADGDTSGTNLNEGTYDVQITDANGCTRDTTLTLTDPTEITITLDSTDANCGVDDGEVNAVAVGGTGVIGYDWDIAPEGYDGLYDDGPTQTGLAVGCYSVTVQDQNFCTATAGPICVINSAAPTVTYVTTQPTCEGSCDGSIVPTITGTAPPYVTTWSASGGCTPWTDPGTDPIFGLCECDYTFTVTDTNNCVFTSVESINAPSVVDVTAVLTNIDCFEDATGEINITASGGTPIVPAPAYTYSWTGPGGFTSTDEDLTNLVAGTYCVEITDDNGCTKDSCFTLTEGDEITTNIYKC